MNSTDLKGLQSFDNCVMELRGIAEAENLSFCEESAKNARDFYKTYCKGYRPSIFLVAGEGGIRLSWQKDSQEISMKFLADSKRVWCIIFHNSPEKEIPLLLSASMVEAYDVIVSLGLLPLLRMYEKFKVIGYTNVPMNYVRTKDLVPLGSIGELNECGNLVFDNSPYKWNTIPGQTHYIVEKVYV